MATSINPSIQNIQTIAQLDRLIQEAERNGEQVVHLEGNSVRVVKYNAVDRAANWASGQSARQAASLDHFAVSLREAEHQANGTPLLDRDARARNLIGKTIDAKVASHFVGNIQRGGTVADDQAVQFDGTGKIKGFSQGAVLSELELFRLESSVVQDLRAANAKGDRDVARTASECVLEALGALQKEKSRHPNTTEGQKISTSIAGLETTLQKLWLSGEMTTIRAAASLNYVATNLRTINPEIAEQISQLSKEAYADKALTQQHDNTFGRMFESAVGKHLVEHPSAQMLQTAAVVNKFLLSHMLTPQKHYTVESNINTLAEHLKKDARPWHAEVPAIQGFLNQPNVDTLRALLEQPIDNGYQMMTAYWVAAKVSAEVTGPWMNPANDNYKNLVRPSRSSDSTPLSAAGVEHTARACAVGEKILENVVKELDRPGAKETFGLDQAALRALRDGAQNLNSGLFKASGTYPSNGQLLPADREAILGFLSDGQKLLAEKFPEAATELYKLYAETSASETLAVGTKNAGKSNIHAGAQEMTSNRYGTGLVHQPKPEVPESWQAGVHIPSKAGLNVDVPTAFEQAVLDRSQNTVNGVSGTTNMLTFMLLHMQKVGAFHSAEGQPLDMNEAFAGNLTFLLMDGGHSIPEAMATSASILANPKYYEGEEFAHVSTAERADAPKQARAAAQEQIRRERQHVLDNHVTNYATLGEQLGGPETASRVAQAVAQAFEDTRRSFDEIHRARTV